MKEHPPITKRIQILATRRLVGQIGTADEMNCLPGERLRYVSVGGLESSRVALPVVSTADVCDVAGNVRVRVHGRDLVICGSSVL